MKAPSMRDCRKPSKLQNFLAGVARAITKIEAEPCSVTSYDLNDEVSVMEDGVRCTGKIEAVYPDDYGLPTTYGVYFPGDADHAEGYRGTYDAEDFC